MDEVRERGQKIEGRKRKRKRKKRKERKEMFKREGWEGGDKRRAKREVRQKSRKNKEKEATFSDGEHDKKPEGRKRRGGRGSERSCLEGNVTVS